MREICETKGIPVDIEWDDAHRIYGDDWYRFHERCRAMLASESDANLYDDFGAIRTAIEKALAEKPDLGYSEAFERFLKDHEGKVVSAQISPRVFEAIALGTALVMFEGRYDDIVEPGVHYIPLKKDFSNADEVLRLLADDDFVTRMIERAQRDIVLSGRYTYKRMVETFDAWMEARVGPGCGFEPITSVVGYRDPFTGALHTPHASFARGYPSEQIFSWRRDDYEKYPSCTRSLYRLPGEVDEPQWRPEPPREKWLLKVPGVRLFDRHVGKPFHRFWEHHRKRLLRIEEPAEEE
jgi:hypothetical protein